MVTKWDDFTSALECKHILLAPFCGDIPCEDNIKNDSARYVVLVFQSSIKIASNCNTSVCGQEIIETLASFTGWKMTQHQKLRAQLWEQSLYVSPSSLPGHSQTLTAASILHATTNPNSSPCLDAATKQDYLLLFNINT